MLSIAVCDDETDQIARTIHAIDCCLSGCNAAEYHIETFSNPLEFLHGCDNGSHFDIIFLDICMPGLDGTQVAREIRSHDELVQIVFITVSDEYAVDAFSLDSAHYLLKPFTQSQFDSALRRALRNLPQVSRKTIICRTEGESVSVIAIDGITYIESHGHTQLIHMETEEIFEDRCSLAAIFEELETLSPRQFVSPYRGFVVNQRSIRQIRADGVVLKDGAIIPIAHRGFRKMRTAYFDFLFS